MTIQYGTIVYGSPPCSRCCGPAAVDVDETQVVVVADGKFVCDGCLTPLERIQHGEKILRGLESRADALRRSWLADDYDHVLNAEPSEAHRVARRHGPVPSELQDLCEQSWRLEELLDDMRYVADWPGVSVDG